MYKIFNKFNMTRTRVVPIVTGKYLCTYWGDMSLSNRKKKEEENIIDRYVCSKDFQYSVVCVSRKKIIHTIFGLVLKLYSVSIVCI